MASRFNDQYYFSVRMFLIIKQKGTSATESGTFNEDPYQYVVNPNDYLNFNNMMNNMVVFMDKALMVFTTMMVLLLGEIDISIASIMCLSGCCTGVAFEAGLPIVPAMMVGLRGGGSLWLL